MDSCMHLCILVAGLWNLVAIPDGNIPSAVGTACNILVFVPCFCVVICWDCGWFNRPPENGDCVDLTGLGESKHRTDPMQTADMEACISMSTPLETMLSKLQHPR